MATGVQNAWSTTPASNATADSSINLREGWAPSVVNDSARALMAIVKKWVKDWQGGLVTGGSSTAYTLTTNESLTLADGVSVVARMSATNGAAPTLNVDSTGAVAIQSVQGTAIPSGTLLAGGVYKFTYYAASAAWIVNGVFDATGQVSAATTSLAGKVELATDAETQTGTDTERAITPSNLSARTATESRTGIAELATTAEATTGTDTARTVTPAGLKAHVDDRVASQSDMETATSNTKFVTPGRAHYHPGSLKFWAKVTVSAGTPSVADSYNVDSITDDGTGILTVTIANDFGDGDWCAHVQTLASTSADNSLKRFASVVAQAAGSITMRCWAQFDGSTANLADPLAWFVSGAGDFA